MIKYLKSLWSLPYAVDAVPCRIAFERGKERHFCFLAISLGTSGWILLLEELPLKQHYGVVRVVAPLAGCNVCILIHLFLLSFLHSILKNKNFGIFVQKGIFFSLTVH